MSQPVELPRWMDVAVLPAVNLAFALLMAGAVVALVGFEPGQCWGCSSRAPSIQGWHQLYAVLRTTFVFTGLAVAVAFHGGLFNIGGEGQAIMGGLGAGLVALAFAAHLPAWRCCADGAGCRTLRHDLGRRARCAAGLARQPHRHRDDHVQLHRRGIAVLLLGHALKEPGNMSPKAAPSPLRTSARHARGAGLARHRVAAHAAELSLLLAVAAAAASISPVEVSARYALRAFGFAPDAARYAGMRRGG